MILKRKYQISWKLWRAKLDKSSRSTQDLESHSQHCRLRIAGRHHLLFPFQGGNRGQRPFWPHLSALSCLVPYMSKFATLALEQRKHTINICWISKSIQSSCWLYIYSVFLEIKIYFPTRLIEYKISTGFCCCCSFFISHPFFSFLLFFLVHFLYLRWGRLKSAELYSVYDCRGREA